MAGPMVGAEYVPSGLGDLAWVSEEQLSGSLVGETDGLLMPPLRMVGGYAWGRNAVIGSFSVARIATTVITTDSRATSIRSALRPSADYRRWLMDPVAKKPLFYLTTGLFVVIPFAEETADNASDEDKKALQEAADEAEGRIGAIGGNLGIGAEIRWDTGLGLGIRSVVSVTRFSSSNVETQTVSSLIRSETALTLSYWF